MVAKSKILTLQAEFNTTNLQLSGSLVDGKRFKENE
jgi:hypothetical protein